MNHSLPVTFALILGLFFSACGSDSPDVSDKVNSRELRVEAFLVKADTLEKKLNTTGTLMAGESVELKAEIAGKLVYIGFEEGAQVKKGELLFKVDDAELQAQQSKTQVELELAKKEFERSKELLAIEAISQEEYDAKLNRFESLKAEVNLLAARIARCRVEAPFNAYAGLRYKSPGAFVQVGEALGNLVQNGTLKIEFDVPESFATEIQKGQKLRFQIAGNDRVYTAEVYAHSGMMDQVSRNLKVRAKVLAENDLPLPGSFTQIDLHLGTDPEALMVPSESLTPELKGEKVWLIKDGKLQPSMVKTGIRGPKSVQILEGIKEGDTVITTGLLQARPNAAVTIIKLSEGK